MKLANLFLITALVGVVAAIGCSEDSNGGNGGGGTGGSTDDACVGPLCDADDDAKAACNAMIAECNATQEADLTEEQCDEIGNATFCTEGEGGNGGNGGGGGAGGDLGCSILACETDDALKEKCEAAVQFCIDWCTVDPECQADECAGLNVLICNVV